MYSKILIELVLKIIKDKINPDKQAKFRRGKDYIYQICNKMIILVKESKVYSAFMDLEKAHAMVEWKTVWYMLKIYGMDGKLHSWFLWRFECICLNEMRTGRKF